jgi:hypothetical protein
MTQTAEADWAAVGACMRNTVLTPGVKTRKRIRTISERTLQFIG